VEKAGRRVGKGKGGRGKGWRRVNGWMRERLGEGKDGEGKDAEGKVGRGCAVLKIPLKSLDPGHSLTLRQIDARAVRDCIITV